MAMNRILEFSPSPEEAVVSRILVLVHQTVDECFPAVAQANRQFTKTLFSDGERTAIGNPEGTSAAFAQEEDTASDNKPPAAEGAEAHPPAPPAPSRPPAIPPPPPRPAAVTMKEPPYSKATAGQAPQSQAGAPVSGHVQTLPTPKTRLESRQGTALDESMAGLEGDKPDWWSRLLLAAFIAGVVVFIYSIMA
jgi:hypothetical protein